MNEQISALADGELTGEELENLLEHSSMQDLNQTLLHYEAISASIQQRPVQIPDTRLVGAIMQKVSEQEEEFDAHNNVIPLSHKRRRWMIPTAAAASLAAAMFAYNANYFTGESSSLTLAETTPTTNAPSLNKPAKPVNPVVAKAANPKLAMDTEGMIASVSKSKDYSAIPELDQYMLQHSELASAGQINPTLSYARLVSRDIQ